MQFRSIRHYRSLVRIVALASALQLGCGSKPPTSPSPPPDTGPRVLHVSSTGSDGNSGSIASPFGTLRHGISQLRPGDTLLIRAGNYRERIFEVDFGRTGSTWGNPISIGAYPGEAVTLQVVAGGDNIVRFQDGSVSYVVLSNLVLDGTGGMMGDAGGSLVYTGRSSHHIRLSNVEVKNSTGNGLLVEGNNHEFLNMNVHGNGTYEGYTNSNGFYLSGSNCLVDGGQFWDNESFGLRFFTSAATESGNSNTVRGASFYNNGKGLGLSTSSNTSGGGGIVMSDVGNVAVGNIVYSNAAGILVFGGKPADGVKVQDNSVYTNTGFGIEIQRGAHNTEVRNNAVYGNLLDIVDDGAGTILTNNRSAAVVTRKR